MILREYKPGKGLELEHRSVFGFTNNLIKSLATADGQRQAGHESPLSLPTSSRHNVGKATLPKDRLSLIITDISAKSIREYPNIELFIRNITDINRKAKFAKAIRAAASQLNVPVSVGRKGAGEIHISEPYLYPVQQELSDQWTSYYQGIIKQIYDAVITALDGIEVMRKARGGGGILKYHGKVIYNPETGKPLKVKEFNALIKAMEEFWFYDLFIKQEG